MALDFTINETNSFTIILENSSGDSVTGETSSSVTTYASKNGGSSFSPSFSSFNEIDSSNMPGLYSVEFSSSVFDTRGELVFNFTGSNFQDYRARGFVGDDVDQIVSQNQGDLTDIKGGSFDPSTDNLSDILDTLSGDLDSIKGNQFDINTDNLSEIRDNIGSTDLSPVMSDLESIKGPNFSSSDALDKIRPKIDDISQKTARVLGLSDENLTITNHTYDNNSNVKSADVTIYPSKSDLENEVNPLAEYKMSAEYNQKDELINYSIKKTS